VTMPLKMRLAIMAENEAIARRMEARCIEDALNTAQTAIDAYYNGDRVWAERWLLRAYEANQEKAK
jgi:hypothetical protein